MCRNVAKWDVTSVQWAQQVNRVAVAANDRIEIVNPENDLAPEQILKSHIRHISDIGEFFSKVKVSYVISTTFEFYHQKVDAKFLENGMFPSNDGFSTISNVQNLSFGRIWQAEMPILVRNFMLFWWKNSNVVEISPKI